MAAQSGPSRAGSSDEELIDRFIGTSLEMRRLVNARLTNAGLSFTSAGVLRRLAESGDVQMGELSRELGITARSLTSTIDILEAEQMVMRETHPRDGRATLLRITPRGRKHFQLMRETMLPVQATLLSGLTASQRRSMATILEALRTAARAARESDER